MELLSRVGEHETGNGQFSLPVTIIMDSKGNLIVNERGNSRIQKFDSNGTFLLKFGSAGKGDGQFSEIEHMATDSFDNIYVNDPQSGPDGAEWRVSKNSIQMVTLLQNSGQPAQVTVSLQIQNILP